MQEPLMKPLLLGRLKNHLCYVEETLTTATSDMMVQLKQLGSLPMMTLKNKRLANLAVCAQNKTSSNLDNIKLWHLRLGYMPFNRLHIVFPDLDCNNFDKNFLCTICPLGKQRRKSFSKSSIRTTDSFQLIHIDLWGPMKFPNRLRCNTFCTIVDDFSRFTWVMFIQHKNEFLTVFKQFHTLIRNQFGKEIKIVRTDNAKELS
jgi:gag-pre-integrase-like protein/integrase-like protein